MPEFRNQHVSFEEKDANIGLTFRLAKTEQDLKASVNFFFEVFLQGKLTITREVFLAMNS